MPFPNSRAPFPNSRGAISKLTGAISKRTGAIPKLTGAIPNLTGVIPKLTGAIPKLTEVKQEVCAVKRVVKQDVCAVKREVEQELPSNTKKIVKRGRKRDHAAAERLRVWLGVQLKTRGGLHKRDLIKNKAGKIVSKKAAKAARQRVLKGDAPSFVNFACKRETSRNNLPDGERRKFRKTNKRGEIF